MTVLPKQRILVLPDFSNTEIPVFNSAEYFGRETKTIYYLNHVESKNELNVEGRGQIR